MPMKIGYIRVSTQEQNTVRQEDLMERLGVELVYMDKLSGKARDRPALQTMMGFVRAGDTVVVESISRFARNTRDLLELIEQQSTGTAFEIQTQYIRTGSTCQLWKYEKCCSFLFVSGYFRIIHKRHVEILRSCSLRQQLRLYNQPLTDGIGYIIAPATGRKG